PGPAPAAGITAPAQAAGPAPAAAAPAASGEATLIPANGRPIALEVGGGTLIRLPRAANTVFVANPDIADVQVKSPTLVYVSAKAPGQTVIYAVDANDRVLLNAAVRVQFDLSQLRQSLNRLVPGNAISVSQIDSNLVLSGAVASAGQAEKARTLALAASDQAKGSKVNVINRLSVATPNQVNLQVRIAEVDRKILKQIGVDWNRLGRTVSFNTNNDAGLTSPSNLISIGMLSHVAATIDALATDGFLTVLAEPNLTAVSGQTASFLAGGEFPYPIAQPGSVGNNAIITVQFQQFGVQLAFTPTIIDADHLSLRVRPEVSQLDFADAVTVAGSLVPALTVDRAETTVELASGQSFALAGLLMHNTSQNLSKVPWLGDVPILGALFRSNKFQNDETELVVIVTPYLVRPATMALATPLDGFAAPHDAQQVLWGDTWRQSLPGPARGPLGAGGSGLIGPAGFRLN
ncbi:MAG: type II and III secretion system protein family protein, partial [Stellaceae bacterium]